MKNIITKDKLLFYVMSLIMIGVGIFSVAYLAPKYENDNIPDTSPEGVRGFGILFIIVGLLVGVVGIYT